MILLGMVVGMLGCAEGGSGLVLRPVGDQVAYVNQEFVIVFDGSDVSSSGLTLSVDADIVDIKQASQAGLSAAGDWEFRWTPKPEDLGVWDFVFTLSDETSSDSQRIQIEVKTSAELLSIPRFSSPAGDGIWLDLSQESCVQLSVEVVDVDSFEVVIQEEEPKILGATLTQGDGLDAVWEWCPSKEQIEADNRYTLNLSADDGEHPKTMLSYVITLRRAEDVECSGMAPVIEHTSSDEQTLAGLTISATIRDDIGIKDEALVFYGDTPPTLPVDLSTMTQATMLLLSGNTQDGVWAADIPNPVTGLSGGESRELFYVIVAYDDDDPNGVCNHATQMPATGTYSMEITHPGGSGDALICESCTSDVQCGGTSDRCVALGVSTFEGICTETCMSSATCPDGFTCSLNELVSLDGVSSRLCVPSDGACPGDDDDEAACIDDNFEDNDTIAVARLTAPLGQGVYDLVSCPFNNGASDDEDWFRITLENESNLEVEIEGTNLSDLDLVLYDQNGVPLISSDGVTSSELVRACLPPGDYFVQVTAVVPVSNPYVMSVDMQAASCGPTIEECVADSNEDDDDIFSARAVELPHFDTEATICSGDDDWYQVWLWAGQTLTVDLNFNQTSADQDLDVHLYTSDNVDLTPCSVTDPTTCLALNGQSATSNENFEAFILRDDLFYVVVRGFDGAENTYDIQINAQ